MEEKISNNPVVAAGAAHIIDVPDHILMEIFSKLSVKSIRRCTSVCKNFFHVLANPDFIQLHSIRASVCPLICPNYGVSTTIFDGTHCGTFDRKERSSRSLRLLEFDSIVNANDGTSDNLNLAVFKLPRRQRQSQTRSGLGAWGFTIVNSCNGFLCLQDKSNSNNFFVAIYNPVTNECSIIPVDGKQVSVFGLGFCASTNQYKVLLTKDGCYYEGLGTKRRNFSPFFATEMAFIYTLGPEGGGWREVESPPSFSCCSVLNPVFLNGALHWLAETYKCSDKFSSRRIGVMSIVSFNFEREKFQIFPHPRVFV